MSLPTVFISYNPDSDLEQTLAVRLHTIGAVSGFDMLLPDRSRHSKTISLETKNRINIASYFILFSTSPLSAVVQQEIAWAFDRLRDRSRIIIIYDQRVGKNLKNAENCTEIYVDLNAEPQSIASEITSKLKSIPKNGSGDFSSGMGALLLTGLGLFALASILDDSFSKPKKRSGKTTARKKPAKKTTKTKRRV
ncbi:hypothetical protein [Chryseolinea lacunae]|uniref:TIR domain-containing protein n=1 Tax=Chryseolinea lacunae TaxID=2801331 RepID=A0ABS1KZZ2_9BACT|nr:hypothetical protein [Chryseolinea lacunae]MBL0745015.1 hypothetical protein [Chryseolinea lacunae]